MGINKKRIAERQRAAQQAKKQEQNKRIVKLTLVIVAVLAVIFGTIALLVGLGNKDKNDSVANKTYYADIVIKDYGKIVVELDGKAAPITVENFISLYSKDLYFL